MTLIRLMDANFNRAREALRVMEDTARFVLNRKDLSQAIKHARHDLAALSQQVPNLLEHRDTPNDVGTSIQTTQEQQRASIHAVVVAACKRLSEALRSLEETTKTLPGDGSLPQGLEQLRYRGYELERQLLTALSPCANKQWRVCVLLTQSMCHLPWQDVLEQSLQAGADCIQVREKTFDGGALLSHTQAVLQQVAGRAAVIVNDRADVALAAGAQGVHVGQTDVPVAALRRVFGRQLLIGVSTHCLADAQQALQDGADNCGVGPMFETTTKNKGFVAGASYLKQFIDWGQLPHLAIGGITPDNIDELANVGVQGVAVSSIVCNAKEPGDVVQRLIEGMA